MSGTTINQPARAKYAPSRDLFSVRVKALAVLVHAVSSLVVGTLYLVLR